MTWALQLHPAHPSLQRPRLAKLKEHFPLPRIPTLPRLPAREGDFLPLYPTHLGEKPVLLLQHVDGLLGACWGWGRRGAQSAQS